MRSWKTWYLLLNSVFLKCTFTIACHVSSAQRWIITTSHSFRIASLAARILGVTADFPGCWLVSFRPHSLRWRKGCWPVTSPVWHIAPQNFMILFLFPKVHENYYTVGQKPVNKRSMLLPWLTTLLSIYWSQLLCRLFCLVWHGMVVLSWRRTVANNDLGPFL